MNTAQDDGRPRRESRPILPDAPEWFNQARLRANQRQTYRPRPAPLPNRWWWARSESAWFKQIRRNSILIGALLALPAVFCAGFWTHGTILPAQWQTAEARTAQNIDEHLAQSPDAGAKLRRSGSQVAVAQVHPAQIAAPQAEHELAAAPHGSRPSLPGPVAAGRGPALPAETASPSNESVRNADGIAWRGDLPLEENRQPVSGFDLATKGEVQLVADVRLPEKSWFESATDDVQCQSGFCAPLPAQPIDRKLNTALVWSTSPESAAAEARRDGKLVFLIHVSGNFAQPGFT